MSAWDDLQDRAVARVLDALDTPRARVLLVAPTGFGKTRCAEKIIRRCLECRLGVLLLTNRTMLVDQLSAVMSDARIPHGMRAAGHEAEAEHLLQLAMVQTEVSRVLKLKSRKLHNAALVIVDEAHIQRGDKIEEIMRLYFEAGANILGITATPIGLSDLYDTMIEAATIPECFKVGALVESMTYAPDEPDLKAFKKLQKARRLALTDGKDFTEAQAVEAMGPRPELFGRIWENFEKLNPGHKPTILFAPDVPGSIWLAEAFTKKGCRAAHLDGDHIWLDGELHRTSPELRAEVLNDSRSGRVRVLCNRFVLREGIDCPWLEHGILATVFGSLQSYLQSGGRLLRSHTGLERVTIQDHGGNYWRHGSLNEPREWRLDLTASSVYDLRATKLRNDPSKVPFTCPQCNRVWIAGRTCSPARGGCGFELPINKKPRRVVSTDGELKFVDYKLFPARKLCRLPDGPKIWESMYWRAKSKKWDATFRQAEAKFAEENNWQWPDPSWPLMAIDPYDRQRRVSKVPMSRLVPKEALVGA